MTLHIPSAVGLAGGSHQANRADRVAHVREQVGTQIDQEKALGLLTQLRDQGLHKSGYLRLEGSGGSGELRFSPRWNVLLGRSAKGEVTGAALKELFAQAGLSTQELQRYLGERGNHALSRDRVARLIEASMTQRELALTQAHGQGQINLPYSAQGTGFEQTFSRTAHSLDFEHPASALDLRAARKEIESKIKAMGQAVATPHTLYQAQAITEAVVGRLLTIKQSQLATVAQRPELSEAGKDALTKTVLAHDLPQVDFPGYLLRALPAARRLLPELVSGNSARTRLAALDEFRMGFERSVDRLSRLAPAGAIGGDEVQNLTAAVISCASELAGFAPSDWERVYDGLTAPDLTEVRAGLAHCQDLMACDEADALSVGAQRLDATVAQWVEAAAARSGTRSPTAAAAALSERSGQFRPETMREPAAAEALAQLGYALPDMPVERWLSPQTAEALGTASSLSLLTQVEGALSDGSAENALALFDALASERARLQAAPASEPADRLAQTVLCARLDRALSQIGGYLGVPPDEQSEPPVDPKALLAAVARVFDPLSPVRPGTPLTQLRIPLQGRAASSVQAGVVDPAARPVVDSAVADLDADVHQLLAQSPGAAIELVSRLGEHRAAVVALPEQAMAPADRAWLIASLDHDTLALGRAIQGMGWRADASDAEVLDRLTALRQALVPVTPQLKAFDRDVLAEILARQEPVDEFAAMAEDMEGTLSHRLAELNLERMQNRVALTRADEANARVVIEAGFSPQERQELQARALALQTQNEALKAGAQAAGTAQNLASVQERVAAAQIKTSSTLQGLSGGGETAAGQAQAQSNWAAAGDFARELARGQGLPGIEALQTLNRLLTVGLPGNGGEPGQWRTRIEREGHGLTYPMPALVPSLMAEFEQWLAQAQKQLPPPVLAAEVGRRLISIHPFPDANGRSVRLFTGVILQQAGLPGPMYEGEEHLQASFYDADKRDFIRPPASVAAHLLTALERSVAAMAAAQ